MPYPQSTIVLITAATDGIGRATAFAFAERGARLILVDSTEAALTQTALDLERDLDAEVLAIPADLSQPDQVKALVDQALQRFNRIDCLINHASQYIRGAFSQLSLDQFQSLLAGNFWSYVHLIQAVLPSMLQQGQGQIINIGSVAGKMPLSQMTAYCASKYAVTGLTEALRLELKPKGIEVIGVYPGVQQQDFADSPSSNQIQATLEGFLVGESEEIAAAILEAATEHQSEVIVGMAQVAVGAYTLFPDLIGDWI